jgi:hypothetical protein
MVSSAKCFLNMATTTTIVGSCCCGSSSSSSGTCCGCVSVPANTLYASGSLSATLTRSGSTWSGTATQGGCTFSICLSACTYTTTCTCNDYVLNIQCEPCGSLTTGVSCGFCTLPACSCSPFSVSYCCASASLTCCSGTQDIYFTITE